MLLNSPIESLQNTHRFVNHFQLYFLSPCVLPLLVVCVLVGRMAWLSVPSSTDTDLTSSTTPNCARCHRPVSHNASLPSFCSFAICPFICYVSVKTHLFPYIIPVIAVLLVTNFVSLAVNAQFLSRKKSNLVCFIYHGNTMFLFEHVLWLYNDFNIMVFPWSILELSTM